MSAKLESTYNQSPDRTAHRLRKPKLAMSSLDSSQSPKQQITDRLCANRSIVTKNLQEIYMKQTERYLIKSSYNSPVLLTENQESSVRHTSSWKFFDNIQHKKSEDEVSTLQKFLMNFGLLQVFRSFQQFRERVIQILSDQKEVQSNKCKIQIYQTITTLKMQLQKIYQSYEQKECYGQELKEILVRVSKLRRENDFLIDKNNQLSHKLSKYQNNQFLTDNSLLQNTIRFSDTSHLTDQSVSQLSLDLQVENLKINQFQTDANSIYTSENSAIESDYKQLIVERKQSRIEVVESQQFRSRHSMNIELWKQTLQKCIEIIKKLMKNQFEATSLALIRSKCSDQVTRLLTRYKSFKVYVSQQVQESYLSEINNFIQFIGDNSSDLCGLISKVVEQLKQDKVIKSTN